MKINLFISNSNMKKFVLKFILIVLPILLVIVTVNYYGDAAKIFNFNYEKKMIMIINKGYYITNISNYDERLFRKELINNLQKKPDIIIIGSSRTMLINKNFFLNTFFINNSVSGASIEDIIAIYQMYKEKNILPKKIIIGIDPWTFNENNGQKRWQSLIIEYNHFLKANKISEIILNINKNKYLELFSISYFQSSLKNIPKLIRGEDKPLPTLEKFNITNTLLTDGSLVYGKSIREASSNEIDKKVNQYIQGTLYSIEEFDTLSPRIIKLFTLLIEDMLSENIEIIFFLSPYHPSVYQVINDEYPMVIKTEEYILEYSKTNNLTVYGSFNPTKIDLDASHFYDGMHCKEIGIKLILSRYIN